MTNDIRHFQRRTPRLAAGAFANPLRGNAFRRFEEVTMDVLLAPAGTPVSEGESPWTGVESPPFADVGPTNPHTTVSRSPRVGRAGDHLDLDPPLSDSTKYRMCGNGVGSPVAEWLGWRLAQALEAA